MPLYSSLAHQNHRMIEYSELEGLHKDHQAQILIEWPVSKLTTVDHSDRCKERESMWGYRMSDPRSLLLLGQIKEEETERHLCPWRVVHPCNFQSLHKLHFVKYILVWSSCTQLHVLRCHTKPQSELEKASRWDLVTHCTASLGSRVLLQRQLNRCNATMAIPGCDANKQFSLIYYSLYLFKACQCYN